MRLLTRWLPVLLAPLFLVLGAAQAFALDHLSVQLAFYPQGPQTYLFLAKDKGWYRDAGLDVELLNGRGSNYSIQVLSSGHADIGEGHLTPLMFARQHGAKIKSIAEWYRADGLSLIVGKDTGIKTLADLKGKRIGIVAAGPWPPILPSFLKQFKLTKDDLQLVYLSAASLFTTYRAKQLDGLLTVDLAFTEANPLRPSVMFEASDYGVKIPGTGLYVREDELTGKKADIIKRFLKVSVRAIKYIANGHEAEGAEAIHHLRPQTKLSVEHLTAQVKMMKVYRETPATKGKPEGWQSPADWKERVAYLKGLGLLKGDPAATDFYTNALLPGAAK